MKRLLCSALIVIAGSVYAGDQPAQSAIISQGPPPGMTDPFGSQQPPPPPPSKVYNLPPPKPVYEERMMWDYNCRCYLKVLNQIGWD